MRVIFSSPVFSPENIGEVVALTGRITFARKAGGFSLWGAVHIGGVAESRRG